MLRNFFHFLIFVAITSRWYNVAVGRYPGDCSSGTPQSVWRRNKNGREEWRRRRTRRGRWWREGVVGAWCFLGSVSNLAELNDPSNFTSRLCPGYAMFFSLVLARITRIRPNLHRGAQQSSLRFRLTVNRQRDSYPILFVLRESGAKWTSVLHSRQVISWPF